MNKQTEAATKKPTAKAAANGSSTSASKTRPKTQEEIKAAARAYALSAPTQEKRRKIPYAAITHVPVQRGGPGQPVARPTVQVPNPASVMPQRAPPPPTRAPPPAAPPLPASLRLSDANDDDLDDYARFVKSLGLDDSWKLARDDDDEEEFQLDPMDEDEDDEDEDDQAGKPGKTTLDAPSQPTPEKEKEESSTHPLDFPEAFNADFMKELEEELGWLEEEDMEAAVATLLEQPKKKEAEAQSAGRPGTPAAESEDKNSASETTPLRDAARAPKAVVTPEQYNHLKRLMDKHYQLLIQQAVLAVRSAHKQKQFRADGETVDDYLTGAETGDDLVEILDGAAGMLQDLDQNRKDAIRYFIQFESANTKQPRRSLLSELAASNDTAPGGRRLTRAQFNKTLLELSNGQMRTVFDIQGLSKLNSTFTLIDNCVDGVHKGDENILEVNSYTESCRLVLNQAGAQFDTDAIPGVRDVSLNFVDAKEHLGQKFKPPCNEEQKVALGRNRNLFTSGEDNLVLRGVNLYGEKQWMLIADRFLPDRSINIISQRYSRLCLMMYKANGVYIDEDGNLKTPPKFESIDDLNEEELKKLKKVDPPAILNVHRWSPEEDLTLLKAVPLMGNMWAELAARLIPHRDRGHLRKRYQVLERRVKATVNRINKTSYLNTSKYGNTSPSKLPPSTPPLPSVPARGPSAPLQVNKAVNQAAAILANARAAAPLPSHRPPYPSYSKPHAPYPPFAPRTGLAQASRPAIHAYTRLGAEMKQDDESSRAAFEALAHGSNDDWSQMSRVKRMLENDTESEVASAIVTQLAKSPAKESNDSIARLDIDKDDDFSMLDSFKASKPSAEGEASNTTSFLAGVLERTNQSGSSKQSKDKRDDTFNGNMDRAAMKPPPPPALAYGSPSKSRKPPPQTTPARTPGRKTIYTTTGTPIGLSPSFRSALTPDGKLAVSPALGSITMGSFPAGAASRMMQYSPQGHSMDGYDLNSMFASANSHGIGTPSPPKNSNSLFRDGGTLMENDLEAISALNSLSTSPARSLLKRASSSQEDDGQEESKGPEKKSLFAKVVGGLETKASSKKKKRRKLKS